MSQYGDFTVTNCVKLLELPDQAREYWSADVKVVRRGHFTGKFRRIIFFEKIGEDACIAGIENKDGVHARLWPEDAAKQAYFIQLLRAEAVREKSLMVEARARSLPIECVPIEKVTAAYMAERGLSHPFSVGYTDQNGQYQWEAVEPLTLNEGR